MAKFPIYQSTGTPTGAVGSVRTNIRVPDNTAQYAAMGQFADTALAVGTAVYKMRGEVELAKAQAADSDDLYKMFANFEKTDPDTYKQQFADTMAGIKAREVKNGWAVRNRNIALEKNTPFWDAKMMEAAAKKTEDMYNSELALKTARAEETGNFADLEATTQRGVDNGWLLQDEVALRLMQVKEKAAIRAHAKVQDVMAMDAGNDPEAFLKLIKTPNVMMKVYEGSVPDDFVWSQGVAGSALAYKNRQVSDWKVSLRHDTIAKAVGGMSAVDFHKQLAQTQGLEPEDRSELAVLFKHHSNAMATTGVNSLASTQDFTAVHEVYGMFRRGEITSLEQLEALWQKDGVFHWSVEKQEQLSKRLDPSDTSEGRFWSDPTIKYLFDSYDGLYLDDKGTVMPDVEWDDWGSGRDDLEQSIRTIWGSNAPDKHAKITAAFKDATAARQATFGAQVAKKGWFEWTQALPIVTARPKGAEGPGGFGGFGGVIYPATRKAGVVQMRNPDDNQVYDVDEDEVADSLKHGWRRVN